MTHVREVRLEGNCIPHLLAGWPAALRLPIVLLRDLLKVALAVAASLALLRLTQRSQ